MQLNQKMLLQLLNFQKKYKIKYQILKFKNKLHVKQFLNFQMNIEI